MEIRQLLASPGEEFVIDKKNIDDLSLGFEID